ISVRARGFSSVSAVKIFRRMDESAMARANSALAMWLALPRPSGSARTIVLPTFGGWRPRAGRHPRTMSLQFDAASCHLIPAGIGLETIAIFLRQPLEFVTHI